MGKLARIPSREIQCGGFQGTSHKQAPRATPIGGNKKATQCVRFLVCLLRSYYRPHRPVTTPLISTLDHPRSPTHTHARGPHANPALSRKSVDFLSWQCYNTHYPCSAVAKLTFATCTCFCVCHGHCKLMMTIIPPPRPL